MLMIDPRLQGFYAVYEGLFEKLARQEETAFDRREERGRNNRDFQYPARFGERLDSCRWLGRLRADANAGSLEALHPRVTAV